MPDRTCSVEGCLRPFYALEWCNLHWRRMQRTGTVLPPSPPSKEERFWAKVEKTDTCWLWTAGRNRAGYGEFRNPGGSKLAHRVAYELRVGPIPEGLTLDHLCRVRNCVRPDHLEPVTNEENIRRGESGQYIARRTHCPHGHPYSGENLYLYGTGRRKCRACMKAVSEGRRGKPRGLPHTPPSI